MKRKKTYTDYADLLTNETERMRNGERERDRKFNSLITSDCADLKIEKDKHKIKCGK